LRRNSDRHSKGFNSNGSSGQKVRFGSALNAGSASLSWRVERDFFKVDANILAQRSTEINQKPNENGGSALLFNYGFADASSLELICLSRNAFVAARGEGRTKSLAYWF
jgi:hypothetical protein